MILRHPGISPTNDLVAKKIFSNPEITCQFIRDMLDLPAKNVTILEGSNIHRISIPVQTFQLNQIMALKLSLRFRYIIRIFSSIACGLTYAVRSIKTQKKFVNEKVIHTRATNILPQYMLSQSWTAIISQMIWLFIALACERTRQERF